MHLDELRDHCLATSGVTEGFPFDNDALVFKVAGKVFALASLERLPPTVNLTCDPERALDHSWASVVSKLTRAARASIG